MESKRCNAQEWYTQVENLCVNYERPICRLSGYHCVWLGEENKCNHCEAAKAEAKGEAK